ncbi:hypothetical protein [Natronobacterium lacisalsi]|uniref:hypothetical protein n=1 Tax=Natronobacterium lacisalsi TaxID=229731 RepID=UPI0012687F54|nr:hypothetical protein [Halobiforma lacisalsi]
MVFRRQLLASGGSFISLSFAGCVSNSEPEGSDAAFSDDPSFSIPPEENLASRRKIDSESRAGSIQGSVAAYDNLKSENIIAIGNYRVLTNGQEWKLTNFRETHDWSHFDEELFGWDSNLVPSSREDRLATVRNSSASYKAEWNVHLTQAHTTPRNFLFQSIYPVDDLSVDERIAEIGNTIKFSETNTLVSDECRVDISYSLIYGDIE